MDCLQVYKFLTQEIHKYFKIKLKRIFVGGDSGGGNLSSALTALIIQKKLHLPSSLFLVYPSLDMRKVYYPSRSHALSDLML
jgi:acetyl esterase